VNLTKILFIRQKIETRLLILIKIDFPDEMGSDEEHQSILESHNSSNNVAFKETQANVDLPDEMDASCRNTAPTHSDLDLETREKSSSPKWTVTKVRNWTSSGSQQLTFLHSADISTISKKASFQTAIDLLMNKTDNLSSKKVFLLSEHEEPRTAFLSNTPIHFNE